MVLSPRGRCALDRSEDADMADVVGLVALSHSPFWDLSFDVKGPGAQFVGGVKKARELVAAKQPDAFVIFGPDHFRNFFYDVLPPFCIGVESVTGFGDYGSPKGEIPTAAAFGRDIYETVVGSGFDPAFSLKMGVDHGISQPYAALDATRNTPVVAIMVNAGGAPRPPLRRCYEFGRSVGAAIRKSDKVKRVMVLGSGGLSHWVRPVSEDDPETSSDTRDYVINGRDRVDAYSAMRDASLEERKKGHVEGRVNPDWDRWFLSTLEAGDLNSIFALDPDVMEETAGNGSHEVRAWLAALGAWGGKVETLSYEPVPRWVTGMGCIAGH
jgi:2,3-dihydroxyphenylpropionate 1,2-dioxygenase